MTNNIEVITVAEGAQVVDACLTACNSMRHLEAGDREGRIEYLQRLATEMGCQVLCRGPREGLHRPICQLPEETKQVSEQRVLRPLERGLAELAGVMQPDGQLSTV